MSKINALEKEIENLQEKLELEREKLKRTTSIPDRISIGDEIIYLDDNSVSFEFFDEEINYNIRDREKILEYEDLRDRRYSFVESLIEFLEHVKGKLNYRLPQ